MANDMSAEKPSEEEIKKAEKSTKCGNIILRHILFLGKHGPALCLNNLKFVPFHLLLFLPGKSFH